MSILFFDTETTGMWRFKSPIEHPSQPNLAQLAAILCDDDGNEINRLASLVYPEPDWIMEEGAQKVHGITLERMEQYGVHLSSLLRVFDDMLTTADVIVGHNVRFDVNVLRGAYHSAGPIDMDNPFSEKDIRCTMLTATPVVGIPKKRASGYKWPKLEECMRCFFGESLDDAHDALVDTRACKRVYFKLREQGHFE